MADANPSSANFMIESQHLKALVIAARIHKSTAITEHYLHQFEVFIESRPDLFHVSRRVAVAQEGVVNAIKRLLEEFPLSPDLVNLGETAAMDLKKDVPYDQFTRIDDNSVYHMYLNIVAGSQKDRKKANLRIEETTEDLTGYSTLYPEVLRAERLAPFPHEQVQQMRAPTHRKYKKSTVKAMLSTVGCDVNENEGQVLEESFRRMQDLDPDSTSEEDENEEDENEEDESEKDESEGDKSEKGSEDSEGDDTNPSGDHNLDNHDVDDMDGNGTGRNDTNQSRRTTMRSTNKNRGNAGYENCKTSTHGHASDPNQHTPNTTWLGSKLSCSDLFDIGQPPITIPRPGLLSALSKYHNNLAYGVASEHPCPSIETPHVIMRDADTTSDSEHSVCTSPPHPMLRPKRTTGQKKNGACKRNLPPIRGVSQKGVSPRKKGKHSNGIVHQFTDKEAGRVFDLVTRCSVHAAE